MWTAKPLKEPGKTGQAVRAKLAEITLTNPKKISSQKFLCLNRLRHKAIYQSGSI